MIAVNAVFFLSSNDIRSPKEIETFLDCLRKELSFVPTTLDLQRRLKLGTCVLIAVKVRFQRH